MDNDEFRALWKLLDAYYSEKTAVGKLTDLHHGGKINFAKRVKDDIDAWCNEVIARAKAEHENTQRNFDALRESAGDQFDKIEPNYVNGLDFGDTLK